MGELIELVASVVRVGGSAMTVAVDMIREDLMSGHRKAVVRGTFEMVAVNAGGRPIRIPKPKHVSQADKEMAS